MLFLSLRSWGCQWRQPPTPSVNRLMCLLHPRDRKGCFGAYYPRRDARGRVPAMLGSRHQPTPCLDAPNLAQYRRDATDCVGKSHLSWRGMAIGMLSCPCATFLAISFAREEQVAGLPSVLSSSASRALSLLRVRRVG